MSLSTNVVDLATRLGTECKSIRSLLNGNTADLSALTTTAKSNLVAAINELAALIASSSSIDDGTVGTSTAWSSSKTQAEIAAGLASLVDGAPAALDTLNELAAALADNADFATTVTNALGVRVRVDAAQTFTAPQQAQGRTNIDAASATDVGSTTTNYVTAFETALV